jgi:two-component system cell cycle response regulator DivK
VASPSPNADARDVGPKGRPLVLIVDDNAQNLKLARDVLRADGFLTTEATCGREAIDAAASVLPDVVLLDLRLPDMDGLGVLRELKARRRTAWIPVVALTAVRTADDGGWLREAGFAGCIEKPITVRDFPSQVRRYVQQTAM